MLHSRVVCLPYILFIPCCPLRSDLPFVYHTTFDGYGRLSRLRPRVSLPTLRYVCRCCTLSPAGITATRPLPLPRDVPAPHVHVTHYRCSVGAYTPRCSFALLICVTRPVCYCTLHVTCCYSVCYCSPFHACCWIPPLHFIVLTFAEFVSHVVRVGHSVRYADLARYI